MTKGTPARPQTGTARKASKDRYRERPQPDDRPLMTIEQAAVYLGVSRHTIYRLIKTGELAVVYVRSFMRLRPVDLDAYVRAQTVGTEQPAPPVRSTRRQAS